MQVILSIKPIFVEKIFKREKLYEYRKVIFKRDVSSVLVYTTTPICKITGEFTIDDILEGSPDEIWKITHNRSGISEEFYRQYFLSRKTAYAIKIGKVIQCDIEPTDIIKNFVAPQSFRYV